MVGTGIVHTPLPKVFKQTAGCQFATAFQPLHLGTENFSTPIPLSILCPLLLSEVASANPTPPAVSDPVLEGGRGEGDSRRASWGVVQRWPPRRGGGVVEGPRTPDQCGTRGTGTNWSMLGGLCLPGASPVSLHCGFGQV